jgi:glycosyltransferase involved in cell wall biosynthesis
MNILFLSRDYPPHLIGGVGVYIHEISRLLAKSGHNVYVITGAEEAPLEYIEEGIRVSRVRPKRIKIWQSLKPILKGTLERLEYSFAVSDKIKEITRAVPIDIIESCEARAEGFWYYLFRNSPPLVIKLHTPETVAFKLDHARETFDYRLIKLLEWFWVSKAVKVVGLSQAVVDLTARHFSLRLTGIKSIPNPIDTGLFRPSLNNHPENNLEILYVGRLEFRKGVHTLIRAFGYVQEKIPGARLTLIGSDCGMKGYLLKKISKLTNPKGVILIEQLPRNRLVEYYQASAVCVVPSVWENYPYACLEAMACGKLVVASAIGGLQDIITHGHDGLFFPNGSSRALASMLIAALEDRGLREKAGGNARLTIEKRYSPQSIARETIASYGEALNNRR